MPLIPWDVTRSLPSLVTFQGTHAYSRYTSCNSWRNITLLLFSATTQIKRNVILLWCIGNYATQVVLHISPMAKPRVIYVVPWVWHNFQSTILREVVVSLIIISSRRGFCHPGHFERALGTSLHMLLWFLMSLLMLLSLLLLLLKMLFYWAHHHLLNIDSWSRVLQK